MIFRPGRVLHHTRRLRRTGAATGLASLTAATAACTPLPDVFTPLGAAADAYGEWDVNGSLPSQATCDEAGIETVRIVLSPSSTSETRLTSPELTFACAAGFFDTGVERILDAGALTYRWQALDATGHVVLESRPYSVVVQRDVEVVFMPVDFLRRAPISVAVDLRFAGDTGFTSCAGALVDTLQWSLHAGDASGPTLAVAAAGTTCTERLTIPESTILTWSEGPATLVVSAAATDGAAWAAQCALTLPYGGPTTVTCEVPRAP